MAYIVANMANACNPSNGQWSSSGRQTSHARVEGTDERELAGQMVSNHVTGLNLICPVLQVENSGKSRVRA